MNNLFRGLLAGWGAAKLGGGCLGTILVFAAIWIILGQCDGNQSTAKVENSKSTTISAYCRASADISRPATLKVSF